MFILSKETVTLLDPMLGRQLEHSPEYVDFKITNLGGCIKIEAKQGTKWVCLRPIGWGL